MGTPRLTRVNPAGDAPTSVDFRKLQDNIEQAIKTAVDATLNWASVEGARLFGPSFQNYGNGREVVSFAQDKSGRVFLRGNATPTLSYITPFPVPALVLSLPASAAPVYDRVSPVDCTGAYGSVLIYGRFGSIPARAGQVYLISGNDPGALSFDGVSFESSK